MNTIYSFPALTQPNVKILILGTMPGTISLQTNQYYAHSRNAFWQIMQASLDIDPILEYPERCSQLTKQGIAVWDVLQSCTRRGSLDSNIEKDSMQPNDLQTFFQKHLKIKAVLFNGILAEQSFKKYVPQNFYDQHPTLHYYRLPSSSPAHASLNLQKKIVQWKKVIEKYVLQ